MWLNFTSARSSSTALAMILHPTRSCSTYSSWTISKMISSTAGITMLIPNVPARAQASFVVVLRQVALDAAPIRPLSERVTWREIAQGRTAGRVYPDATVQKIARGGPQLITYHSMTSTRLIGTSTPKTVAPMKKIRSATRRPNMSLAADVASPLAPLLSVCAKML